MQNKSKIITGQYKAWAEIIPAKDNFYDLIVCIFTIRHTNVKCAVREFIRILKSGGRIVIVDLYAPENWRPFQAKIFLPIIKLFFIFNKKRKAEKKSQLLTLNEWKDLVIKMEGENIKINEFPNISEPN